MQRLGQRIATSGGSAPRDWAELGSRIVRAAALASAVHMAERARADTEPRTAEAVESSTSGPPLRRGGRCGQDG